MSAPDLLTWIQTALTGQPLTPQAVEQTLVRARQTYGGETVYIRASERQKVTRRTLQLRKHRHV